jgi:hypothetical protein
MQNKMQKASQTKNPECAWDPTIGVNHTEIESNKINRKFDFCLNDYR